MSSTFVATAASSPNPPRATNLRSSRSFPSSARQGFPVERRIDSGRIAQAPGVLIHRHRQEGGVMTAKLRVETIATVDGFESLGPEWNALCARSCQALPFVLHEWLFTWWIHYRRDDRS